MSVCLLETQIVLRIRFVSCCKDNWILEQTYLLSGHGICSDNIERSMQTGGTYSHILSGVQFPNLVVLLIHWLIANHVANIVFMVNSYSSSTDCFVNLYTIPCAILEGI